MNGTARRIGVLVTSKASKLRFVRCSKCARRAPAGHNTDLVYADVPATESGSYRCVDCGRVLR